MLQDDPPLTLEPLKWSKQKDMPFKMSGNVQSVVIKDFVYIGWTGIEHDMCTVMKLDLQQNILTKLPQYSAKWFAMTSYANELVLVGGQDPVTGNRINQIAQFTSGRWTNPYPPMITARHSSTAFCFKHYIIVAGGWDYRRHTSSVEVLDVISRGWYIAESLPNPRYELKSTLIGNILYLMGGWDHTGPTKVVHKVDLNQLISRTVSKQATPTLWKSIENTLLEYSTPIKFRGFLLAVGGHDDHGNPSSSIHLYQPEVRRWVKVGEMPTARYNCTCSVLPSGEVIVAGGQTFQEISTVDLLSV